MANAYDQIQMKNGQTRYRMDRSFIPEDKVPADIKEVITLTNIVDENGIVIVEDKGDYGKMSIEEMAKLEKEKGSGTPTPSDVDGQDTLHAQPAALDAAETSIPPLGTPTPSDVDGQDTLHAQPAALDAAETSIPPLGTPPTSPDGDLNTPAALPSVPEGEAERVANLAPRFRSKTPQSDPGMGFKRKNGKTVDIFDLTTPHTHIKLVGGHMVPLSAESYKYRSEAEIERRLTELGYALVDFNQLEEAEAATGDSGDGLEDDDGK